MIADLAGQQRVVVTLRKIEGRAPDEACDANRNPEAQIQSLTRMLNLLSEEMENVEERLREVLVHAGKHSVSSS